MDLNAIQYIPAGRGAGAAGHPRLVVVHGMVNAGGIKRGAARACASYFSNPATKYYAHYSVDPGEVFCSVKPGFKAPHVGNANWYAGGPSIGLEFACYCDDRDDWTTPDGVAEVALGADLTSSLCDAFGISKRWLSDADLRAGLDGITDHATCARALGGSTHVDPGPKFPRDSFMVQVLGVNRPAEVPDTLTPQPSEEDDDMAIIFVRGRNRAEVYRCTSGMGDPILMRSGDQLKDTYNLAAENGVVVVGTPGKGDFEGWNGTHIPVRLIDDRLADEIAPTSR